MTTIPVIRKVLEKNDRAAAENRARFDAAGVMCINILGGAGCGKTLLLEALLPHLRHALRIGVLEGDLATTRDAERIAALDVPVAQLLTDGGCHLTAPHVQRALPSIPLSQLDLLLVENVGNPICPANFDLGEHLRLAVLSVAEGEDKPAKYPLLFRGAHAIVLSKLDLLPFVQFNVQQVRREVQRINPAAPVFETAATTRHGIEPLGTWVLERVRANRPLRR
jgi:hydrogenase nickel incorporation protein HypB